MENVEHKETYKKWKTLVNMSRGELEKFYNSQEGKDAGLSSQEASEQGISSGRESARWIMKMKDTNVSDWTPSMWRWAKKQISFISRMSGNKGPLYDDKGNKTRKHTSLLIWGNNPEKYSQGGLIAPNRKPSNLTPEQYRLVRTPEFKAWFGDWENNPSEASKVVDENGEPLVVYHGTTFDFTIFKKDKPTVGAYGQGFYFTNDKGFASNYARGNNAKFLNCFLNIKKIFTINNDELPNGYEKYLGMADNKGVSRDFTRKIIYENYDGVYAINKYNENELIVFEPNQIKLADGTNTTFDSNNPDIRYNDGGSIPKELYHYTSETNFDRIFDSNILNPSQKYGNRLSFTSDSEYHKKEHGLDYGNTNVRITFDNEKLISDGYSFSQFDHSSKQNKIGKEFEYIISIPIKNVKKYIKSITFFKGNAIVGEIDKTTTDYANKYYLNSDIRFKEGGLIAPNGKPSNLTPEQYRLVRTPAFKKWFGDWENSPETASKVVDENGEPLVLYRGNLKNQDELGYTFKLGENFLKKKSGNNFGFFFTNKIDIAKKYMLVDHFDEIRGGSITSVFIKSNKIIDLLDFDLKIGQDNFVQGLIKKGINFNNGYNYLESKILDFNPDKYKDWGYNVFDYFDVFPELRNLFMENGFNSVIFYEMSRTYSKYKVYVAFNPNQIKLADGTNIKFDGSNPDIRYADGGRIKPIKKSILNNFQSGSSLDFYDNKIFVVGDDTRDLLILNKNFEELNRVRLFESEDRRIAKDLKADLETSTIIEYNGSPSMLMLGSGSKDNKSFGYIINLDTLETEKFKYDIFINRLKDEYGIADVNIEGSACVSDYFLLSNRGNKTNPDNLLIVTENNFWEKQSRVNISLSRILLPNKDAGVSEIYYEIDSDTLFFTASIEHTANNYDDGKIGDSFIGYILNFSSKLYKDTVTPDLFINLTEVDSSFNKQKIEGICIEDNTGGNYVINLVSDNDNDESIIFKIELKKPVRGGSLNSFQQLANRYNGK